jgi:hypothetical protein
MFTTPSLTLGAVATIFTTPSPTIGPQSSDSFSDSWCRSYNALWLLLRLLEPGPQGFTTPSPTIRAEATKFYISISEHRSGTAMFYDSFSDHWSRRHNVLLLCLRLLEPEPQGFTTPSPTIGVGTTMFHNSLEPELQGFMTHLRRLEPEPQCYTTPSPTRILSIYKSGKIALYRPFSTFYIFLVK